MLSTENTAPKRTAQETATHSSKLSRWFTCAAYACGIAGLGIIFWMLWWMQFGFDITDESFYLLWAQNPDYYSYSFSAFGPIYHPILELVGNNVITFRRVIYLVTLVLATSFSYLSIKYVLTKYRQEHSGNSSSRNAWLALSLGIAATSTTTYSLWLTTPNYNILTLQSLLIVGLGLVLFEREVSRRSVIGAVLLGLGGTLLFLSKPTTAALTAVVVLVALFLMKKFSARTFGISVGVGIATLLVLGFALFGGIGELIEFLRDGVRATSLQGSHSTQTLIQNSTIHFFNGSGSPLTLVVVLAVSALVAAASNQIRKWKAIPSIAAVFLAIVVVFLLIAQPLSLDLPGSQVAGFFLSIYLGCLIGFCAVRIVSNRISRTPPAPSQSWLLAVGFGIVPVLYFLGTNNFPLTTALSASIFWMLGSCVFLVAINTGGGQITIVAVFVVVGQLLTAAALLQGFHSPYRSNSPVSESNVHTEFPAPHTVIQMNSENAEYVRSLQSLGRSAGVKEGDSIVELTGQHPVSALALGVRPLGSPWLIGGYPGAKAVAEFAFSRTPCEALRSTWIITTAKSPRAIPTSTLKALGINFEKDYEKAGVITPKYYPEPQTLWRPIRSDQEAIDACITARQ